MVRNLNRAIHKLKNQGYTVVPRAFIWIQGESDADNDHRAKEYYWRLKSVLRHLRNNVLRSPSLPVILSVDEQHPRVQQRAIIVDAKENWPMKIKPYRSCL